MNETNQTGIRRAALVFLALFLAAHAFAFANLTLSGGGLTIYVGGSAGEQIRAGNWLRPLYERLRGGISAPWLMGALSLAFLCASFLLIRGLLRGCSPLRSAALAGCLALHPAVLSVFVSEMNHADAVFLSMLLCCAGARLLLREKRGWLPAAALWGLAASLSPEMWLYGPMLLLAAWPGCRAAAGLSPDGAPEAAGASLRGGRGGAPAGSPGDAQDPGKARAVFIHAASAAFVSFALFAVGLFVMLRRYGVSAPFRPDAASFLNGVLSLPRSYLLPFSAYAPLSAALFPALALLCAFFAFREGRRPRAWKTAALRLVLLLFLSGVSAALWGARTLTLSQPLLAVFFLSLLPEDEELPRLPRRCMAGALAALFLGQIVYANQMHLMKNLEFQSTVSLMTRVLDRVERTEGFIPGKTEAALLGSPGESPLSVAHEGFERLSQFPGAEKHMAAFTESDDAAFVWQVMGYPLNLVSDAERDRLAADPAMRDMPAFPAEGCIRWAGSTLVIRLSP